MTFSNSVNDEFKVHLANTGKNFNGVDLSVRVLTTGFWPGQNAPPSINLPRVREGGATGKSKKPILCVNTY